MAWRPDSLWNPGSGRPEHTAAQQVSVHSAGRRLRSGRTPFPLPVPPNNNPPAPPWPYFAPPDQVLPPYARQPLEAPGPPPGPVPAEAGQPQAGGLTYGTYGSDGKFIDPSGNIGVFAGGVGKALPAETWVDLMSDPRQA